MLLIARNQIGCVRVHEEQCLPIESETYAVFKDGPLGTSVPCRRLLLHLCVKSITDLSPTLSPMALE